MEFKTRKQALYGLDPVDLVTHIINLEASMLSIIDASKNNSGHEPSLSVFHREVDLAKNLLTANNRN